MITTAAAPRAARNPVAPPREPYFPPLTLAPRPPAARAEAATPGRFIVQISPLIHRSLPLPAGLDAGAAERYVRAYAQVHGWDCCLEPAGSRTVYCLSDGTRFEAGALLEDGKPGEDKA